MAEAGYLQSLLPTLSTYLAIDRMGAGIGAVSDGLVSVRCELADLKTLMGEHSGAAGEAALQLVAALPHWRDLSAAAAALQGAPHGPSRPAG